MGAGWLGGSVAGGSDMVGEGQSVRLEESVFPSHDSPFDRSMSKQ